MARFASARGATLATVGSALCLLLATAPASAQCVGDCKNQGKVVISDLVIGVNIALGTRQVSDCEAFANAQGKVNVGQLIKGVNNALNGCPATPTPTNTAPGAATATGTATSTSVATGTATGTATSTPVATGTETQTAHSSPSPTNTLSPTPTLPSSTPTSTPTQSATPSATAGAGLGTRVFTLGGGSGFFTSFLPTVKVGVPAGVMMLVASSPGASGDSTVTVTGPEYFTTVLLAGGVTLCTRVDSCTGTLYCNGGVNVDVTETLDSLKTPPCVQDGTQRCPSSVSNTCCSNACEGVGVGSGNPTVTTTGVNAADSGAGALLMDCTQESVQVNKTSGVDCSTQDYSMASPGHQVYTTGSNTAVVLNHCVGSGALANTIPTFSKTGQNFDCNKFTKANGPGMLVFSIATEEPSNIITGDGSNAGVFSVKDR